MSRWKRKRESSEVHFWFRRVEGLKKGLGICRWDGFGVIEYIRGFLI